MSDEDGGQGLNLLIDRRSILLILGAFGGCLGFGEEEPTDDENTASQREDKVTISESDEGGSSTRQLSASELIEAHVRSLEDKGYESDLTVTDEQAGERVEKEIRYGETEDRAEIFIEEISTVDDGLSSIRYEEDNSGSETIVELDSGETLTADFGTNIAQIDIPVRITGASVYKEFLTGASLAVVSEGSSENEGDGSSTTGTYDITGHDRLSDVEGEVQISTDNVIESFHIVWDDGGFEHEIAVEMTERGSITI